MSAPTPLISRIPGDPEQVRRVSVQLATVEARAGEIESRLRAIESGVGPQVWRGQAADSFGRLLAETGPDLTKLAISYGAASRALATYATELAAAQDAARAAAAEASIATEGRDRATADRDSARSEAVRHAAAADDARIRLDPVAAQAAEQRRADALGRENAAGAAIDQAEQALQAAQRKAGEAAGQRDAAAARCIRELEEAGSAGIDIRHLTQDPATPDSPAPATPDGAIAGGIREAAGATAENVRGDFQDKWYLHTADIVANGVVAGLAGKYAGSLKEEAGRRMRESQRAVDRYRAAPGGSADARYQNNLSLQKFLEADELERRADSVGRRVAGKLPVVGLGITAAGIGYDLSQGKPVVKAVVSGVSGALVAAGIGAAIGGPPGALLGLVFGTAASGAIDWGFDQLPKGLQGTIENGANALGNAIGDFGEKVWDAIF
jgi:hypothetical protein